jgi:hypothetical protein
VGMVEPLIDLKVDIDKFDIIEADVIKLVVVNIAKYFSFIEKKNKVQK